MATVYVRNLDEKLPVGGLKDLLQSKFADFGAILGVSAKKSLRMRGQAFVDFKDAKDAGRAIAALNNTELRGKKIIVELAKSDSDAVHLLKTGNPKKRALQEDQPKAKRQRVPSNVLLLQNLPKDITAERLGELYESREGFIEARVFAVKGIGFVEFDTMENASGALGDFKLGEATIEVGFAK